MRARYILLVLGVLALNLNCVGQSGSVLFNLKSAENKADILYNQGSYKQALPYLKQVYKQKKSSEVLLHIAYAYARLNDDKQATKYYNSVKDEQSLMTTEHVLAYAQSLHQSGKVHEAKEQYQRYASLAGNKIEIADDLGEDELRRNAVRYSIQSLTLNTRENEFSPVKLGNDILFASDRVGSSIVQEDIGQHTSNLDIYKASSRSLVRFTYPEAIKQLNTGQHEGPLCADTAGNIYFSRTEANGKFKLYQAEIKGEDVSQPQEVKINFAGSIIHPAISANGNLLIFASDFEGGQGGLDLYISEKVGGVWSRPENLGPDVNTLGNDAFPAISEEKVYFASDGRIGLGGLDIYWAYRSGRQLQAIENLGAPVNSNKDDFGLAADENGGYFVSNRPGGRGGDDIYRLNFHVITLAGHVVDSTNHHPVSNVSVMLNGPEGVKTAMTDAEGNYSFKVHPGEQYQLTFKAEKGYRPRQQLFSTITGKPYGPRPLTTALDRKTKLFVLGRVRYQNRKRAAEPEILLIDRTSGFVDKLGGSVRGGFEAELDKESEYTFMAICNDQGGIAHFKTPEEYDASLSYYLNVELLPYVNYTVNGQISRVSGDQPITVHITNQVTGQKELVFAEKGQFKFSGNSLCSYQLCVEQGILSTSVFLNEGFSDSVRNIQVVLENASQGNIN